MPYLTMTCCLVSASFNANSENLTRRQCPSTSMLHHVGTVLQPACQRGSAVWDGVKTPSPREWEGEVLSVRYGTEHP